MTLSGEVPVSVSIHRQSQNEEHWLVVMENVERVSAFLSFSQDVSTSLFGRLSSLRFLQPFYGGAFSSFKNVFIS